MSHACAAVHCGTVIAEEKLMCVGHWRLVPQHLQQDITKYFRAMNHGRVADRLIAINNYRVARDAAIAHVDKLNPLI